MKFLFLSTRVLLLVLVLAGAYVIVYAVECPTCQTSFSAPRQLSPSGIDEVASADFNGDSNPDLVGLKSSTNEVLFMAGDGAGNFGTPVSSPVTLSSFQRSLTVADFNNDSKPDLAITNFGANNVLILLGNGTGSFSLAATLTVAPSPARIAVADFNNDGKLDLAVLSRGACNSDTFFCSTNTITVFSGNGAGDFALVGSFLAGPGTSDIAAADFNSDGKIDLVFLSANATGDPGVVSQGVLLALRFGDGTGNFGPSNFIPATPFVGQAKFSHFTIGDFNGDGKPDIAAASSDKFRIYLANGQGGFSAIDNPNYGSVDSVLSVADFNADGKLDLLVNNTASLNSGKSYISLGDGQGHLQLAAPVDDNVSGNSLAIGDFDKDGKPDLAVSDGSVRVLLNQTDCSKPIACVLDAEVSVVEGNTGETIANVTVKLSTPSSTPITVNFSTAEFNEFFNAPRAQSGTDFKPQSGTITFDPFVTSKNVTVSVLGDTTVEPDEPFRVVLTGATGANAVRVPFFVKPPLVRILNDDLADPRPVVSIDDATLFEGNAGTKQAIFTVTLSAPQSNSITLLYHTEDRSAESPADYQEASPTPLTFAAGETTRTISIPIAGDTLSEGDEGFFVMFDDNPSVLFGRIRGVGTILDDDAPVDPAAPQLFTEEGSARAVALDLVWQTAGPFSLTNKNYLGEDKETRISLFARNLNFTPGEDTLTALTVTTVETDFLSPAKSLPVEFVGPVAGSNDLTQIVVRLPSLGGFFRPPGDEIVFLTLHGVSSNKAFITLK